MIKIELSLMPEAAVVFATFVHMAAKSKRHGFGSLLREQGLPPAGMDVTNILIDIAEEMGAQVAGSKQVKKFKNV